MQRKHSLQDVLEALEPSKMFLFSKHCCCCIESVRDPSNSRSLKKTRNLVKKITSWWWYIQNNHYWALLQKFDLCEVSGEQVNKEEVLTKWNIHIIMLNWNFFLLKKQKGRSKKNSISLFFVRKFISSHQVNELVSGCRGWEREREGWWDKWKGKETTFLEGI